MTALTASERGVIEALLALAFAAWGMADNAAEHGPGGVEVEQADFTKLSDCLDVLDALPDDQPGYTMAEAAKARWALRRLLDPAGDMVVIPRADLEAAVSAVKAWRGHCHHAIAPLDAWPTERLPEWMQEKRATVEECDRVLAKLDVPR